MSGVPGSADRGVSMRCSMLVFPGLMLLSPICCAQTTYTCISTNGNATTSTKPCFGLTAQAVQSSIGKKQSNYVVMEMSPGALKAVQETMREDAERAKALRAAAAKNAHGATPAATGGSH
jgi:hypothetical protein